LPNPLSQETQKSSVSFRTVPVCNRESGVIIQREITLTESLFRVMELMPH